MKMFFLTLSVLLLLFYTDSNESLCAEKPMVSKSSNSVLVKFILKDGGPISPIEEIYLSKNPLTTPNSQFVLADNKAVPLTYVDNQIGMIGNIGDTIEIPLGIYTIGMSDVAGYSLDIGLTVDKTKMTITGIEANDVCSCSTCDKEHLIEDWSVNVNSISEGIYELIIDQPKMKQGNRGCYSAVKMWEQQTTLSFKITSTPTNADILVNGKSVGKTDATLNVPCKSADKIKAVIVIRKPGYANCIKDVRSESTTDISCNLKGL